MIPKDVINKIRSVTIHYDDYTHTIIGFSFFDKDGALLWKIGITTGNWLNDETVALAENEVIIGVKAKLYGNAQSLYTNFKFQIAF